MEMKYTNRRRNHRDGALTKIEVIVPDINDYHSAVAVSYGYYIIKPRDSKLAITKKELETRNEMFDIRYDLDFEFTTGSMGNEIRKHNVGVG